MKIQDVRAQSVQALTEAQRMLAEIDAIELVHPDAQRLNHHTGLGDQWVAPSAHAIAQHVDPNAIPLGRMHGSSTGTATHVLYALVPIPGAAPVRVYSPRRVDVARGFDEFNGSSGTVSLPDALRATTEDAELAHMKANYNSVTASAAQPS